MLKAKKHNNFLVVFIPVFFLGNLSLTDLVLDLLDVTEASYAVPIWVFSRVWSRTQLWVPATIVLDGRTTPSNMGIYGMTINQATMGILNNI